VAGLLGDLAQRGLHLVRVGRRAASLREAPVPAVAVAQEQQAQRAAVAPVQDDAAGETGHGGVPPVGVREADDRIRRTMNATCPDAEDAEAVCATRMRSAEARVLSNERVRGGCHRIVAAVEGGW